MLKSCKIPLLKLSSVADTGVAQHKPAGAEERVNMETLRHGMLVHLVKGHVVIIVAVLIILTIGYF
jgi:hypothetical protein